MDLGLDPSRRVLFLSMGAGQDSTALLYKIIYNTTFREEFVGDRQLIVIFCDTQNEHDETMDHVEQLKNICRIWNYPFVHITPAMGYHTGAWKDGLVGQYRKNSTIGLPGKRSRACSDALKISPFYKGANDIIGRLYGFPTYRKAALYSYVAHFNEPIEVWIGFSAGEEHRAVHAIDDHRIAFSFDVENVTCNSPIIPDVWFQKNIAITYPLMQLGMTRTDCQEYIASLGLTVPRPSLCKFCHWKSAENVLELSLTDPTSFAIWCELEANKKAHWEGRTAKNGYVFKDRSLAQVARETRAKYHYLSDADLLVFLRDVTMNHGCSKTAF